MNTPNTLPRGLEFFEVCRLYQARYEQATRRLCTDYRATAAERRLMARAAYSAYTVLYAIAGDEC